MNYSSFRFILDMHKTQSQVSIPVLLGDTSKKLYIGLSDGQEPYVIEDGCIATFVAKKPDGASIFNSCMIENNMTVVYEFTVNTTNAEGIVNCEIRLYGADGLLITSPRFILVVNERVLSDEDISVSEDEYTAISSIMVAEAGRVTAESARAAAESRRVNAEALRSNAELTRVNAEKARLGAENSRVIAETSRVAAEEGRVAAEKKREETWEKHLETLKEATEEILEDERQEIVNEVLERLPKYEGEVDEE